MGDASGGAGAGEVRSGDGCVLWEGFPPEIATWEEEDQIPCGEVDFVRDCEEGLEAKEEGEWDGEESDDE